MNHERNYMLATLWLYVPLQASNQERHLLSSSRKCSLVWVSNKSSRYVLYLHISLLSCGFLLCIKVVLWVRNEWGSVGECNSGKDTKHSNEDENWANQLDNDWSPRTYDIIVPLSHHINRKHFIDASFTLSFHRHCIQWLQAQGPRLRERWGGGYCNTWAPSQEVCFAPIVAGQSQTGR